MSAETGPPMSDALRAATRAARDAGAYYPFKDTQLLSAAVTELKELPERFLLYSDPSRHLADFLEGLTNTPGLENYPFNSDNELRRQLLGAVASTIVHYETKCSELRNARDRELTPPPLAGSLETRTDVLLTETEKERIGDAIQPLLTQTGAAARRSAYAKILAAISTLERTALRELAIHLVVAATFFAISQRDRKLIEIGEPPTGLAQFVRDKKMPAVYRKAAYWYFALRGAHSESVIDLVTDECPFCGSPDCEFAKVYFDGFGGETPSLREAFAGLSGTNRLPHPLVVRLPDSGHGLTDCWKAYWKFISPLYSRGETGLDRSVLADDVLELFGQWYEKESVTDGSWVELDFSSATIRTQSGLQALRGGTEWISVLRNRGNASTLQFLTTDDSIRSKDNEGHLLSLARQINDASKGRRQ